MDTCLSTRLLCAPIRPGPCCAPPPLHALTAGRAAQRMGEIQGIEPCTIHRLLGYQPRGAAGSAEDGSSGRAGTAAAAAAGGGPLLEQDAGLEEAWLGTQGTFQYHRWVGVAGE